MEGDTEPGSDPVFQTPDCMLCSHVLRVTVWVMPKCVLVSLGCHNKSTIDWVAQITEIYFFIVLEAGSMRSGCQNGQVLVRTLFLACRQLPSCCALRGGERERGKSLSFFSYKAIVLWD